MLDEERIKLNERMKYLRLIKRHYLKATRCWRGCPDSGPMMLCPRHLPML